MTTRKMLINTAQAEELRVAITDGQKLFDLDIEPLHRAQKKANIYKAKISRIEPSLNAVFVDYGAERHGFLPIKEISPEYFIKPLTSPSDIKGSLKEGQEIVIQIEKEERGQKGAAVTTYITLAGCYLVLMPNNPGSGGISRRIGGDERQQLKDSLSALNVPDGMGVIIRTAGLGRTQEELQWDLDALLKLWQAIKVEAIKREGPFLIYQESDVILRSIRDYLRQNIAEIIVDSNEAYQRVLNHVKQLRPEFVDRVKLYQDEMPIFNRYKIEQQIETAYQREIRLPSGGSIVIDHTEALTSVDINSSKATKGGDIEETAYKTNLEAASEVARQLRIRDLGGLVVIDFIDMAESEHQRAVEDHLYKALQYDRARVQTNRISRFGLLEMSRQRLRPSLGEATSIVCPRCQGHGTIRSVHSMGISLVRTIKNEALSANVQQIEVQLPVDVATFLLNEKRHLLDEIEQQQHVRILLIPNPHMQTPDFEFHKSSRGNTDTHSHQRIKQPEAKEYRYSEELGAAEKPAIEHLDIGQAPTRRSDKKSLWDSLGKFCANLFGNDVEEEPTPQRNRKKDTQARSRGNQQGQRRGPQNRATTRQTGERPTKNTGARQRNQDNRSERKRSADTENRAATPKKAPVRRTIQPRHGSESRKKMETRGVIAPTTTVVPDRQPEAKTSVVVHAPDQYNMPTIPEIAPYTFMPHENQVEAKTSTRDSAPARLNQEVKDKKTRLTKVALKELMAKIAEQHAGSEMIESKTKSNKAPKAIVYQEVQVGEVK